MTISILDIVDFNHIELYNVRVQNLISDPSSPSKGWTYFNTSTNLPRWWNGTVWVELGTGGGTVTTLSVASANGFTGTVATATTTPVITIKTSITGLLKGNGTAISAATSGTDYAPATNGSSTNILVSNGSGGFGTALVADTDGTLTANSDARIATQKAVKTYVDTNITSATSFQTAISAASNPNYPAATKGQTWVISVAGKIGGASGIAVDVGDLILATATNAGGTQASVGTSWTILEHNLSGVLLAANNLNDVSSPASARVSLGLGALAQLGVGDGLTSAGVNLAVDWTEVPKKYSATVGDGSSTSITVTHGLSTQDVHVSVRDVATDTMLICGWSAPNSSNVILTFVNAPATSSLRVTVIG